MKAMGGYWAFLLLMSWFVLIEVARVATTVWLSAWTSSVDAPGGAAHKTMWYLGIYSGISGFQVQPSVAQDRSVAKLLAEELCIQEMRRDSVTSKTHDVFNIKKD